jgi:branched-subunit amino acid ABC-type transport system permease component
VLIAALSDLTLPNFVQLTINGVAAGALYALLGSGLWMILSVTGRFHFALAVSISLSTYVAAMMGSDVHAPYGLSLAAGAAVGALLGVACEQVVYRPLARRGASSALLTIFVSSLGLTIAGENLIQLFLGRNAQTRVIPGFRLTPITYIRGSYHLHLTSLDVVAMVVAPLLIAAVVVLFRLTLFGRGIQATASNPEMAVVVGVDVERVYLAVFAIGSLLSSVAGVLYATRVGASPSLGSSIIFKAFIVAFLGGAVSAPLRPALVGLGLGLAENWAALFFDSQWTDVLVFVLLLAYVILRQVSLPGMARRLRAVSAAS